LDPDPGFDTEVTTVAGGMISALVTRISTVTDAPSLRAASRAYARRVTSGSDALYGTVIENEVEVEVAGGEIVREPDNAKPPVVT